MKKNINEINGLLLSSKQMQNLKGGIVAVTCETSCTAGLKTGTCAAGGPKGCQCTYAGVTSDGCPQRFVVIGGGGSIG